MSFVFHHPYNETVAVTCVSSSIHQGAYDIVAEDRRLTVDRNKIICVIRVLAEPLGSFPGQVIDYSQESCLSDVVSQFECKHAVLIERRTDGHH